MTKSRTLLTTGIAAAVLLVGFSAHVVATSVLTQPTSANVVAPMVVTAGNAGLNFGSVGNSTAGVVNVVVDPQAAGYAASSSDGADVLTGTGALRAQFNITSGIATQGYTVDFTSNTFPIDASGDGTVTITALTWAGDNGVTLGGGTIDAGGTDTFWVGGNLQLQATPTQGLHNTATYDMDVVYN